MCVFLVCVFFFLPVSMLLLCFVFVLVVFLHFLPCHAFPSLHAVSISMFFIPDIPVCTYVFDMFFVPVCFSNFVFSYARGLTFFLSVCDGYISSFRLRKRLHRSLLWFLPQQKRQPAAPGGTRGFDAKFTLLPLPPVQKRKKTKANQTPVAGFRYVQGNFV